MSQRRPRVSSREFKSVEKRQFGGVTPFCPAFSADELLIRVDRFTTFREIIHSDDTPVKSGHMPAKYCMHHRTTWNHYPAMTGRTFHWFECYRIYPTEFFTTDPLPQLQMLLWKELLVPFDWDQAVRTAAGELSSDFNLLNFIRELPELRSLARSVPRFIAMLRRMRRQGSPLRTMRALAEGRLAYSFGIAPLMDDVQSLFNRFAAFDSQLAILRLRLAKGRKVSYKITDRPHVMRRPGGPGITITYIGHIKTFVSCTVQGEVGGPLQYGIAERLGIRLNLQTIWNATPFSFLVDYILPIGGALSSHNLLEAKLRVSRASVSSKFEGRWYAEKKLPNGSTAMICTGDIKCFIRTPRYPELDGRVVNLPGGGISFGRIANLTALLFANAR